MEFQDQSKQSGPGKPTQHSPSNSEQLRLFAFDLAPVGMCCVNLDARFTQVNEHFCRLLGYDAIELIGMHVGDITHPEDHAAEITHLKAFLRGETPVYEIEKRYLRKDGSVRWVAVTARLIDDGDGRAPHTLAVIRDISDRKAALAALQESEALNRTIVESSPDCIKVLDAEGKIEYINTNGCELMEIDDSSSFSGTAWKSFWPLESEGSITTSLTHARAGLASQFVAFCPTLKGTEKWWEVTVKPALDSQRRCVRIIVSSRDITQRKKSEEALNTTAERLRASVGMVSSFIWTNSPEGKMTGEQPGWGDFTGQTQAEYLGFGWASAVHPDDAQPTIDAWNEAVSLRKSFEFEHRVRRRDGEWRTCSVRAAPRLSDDGSINEWLGVHTDITERKQAEEHIKLLMGEVNHRSKNLLSVVQAIASQTARVGDPASFIARLSNRIQGLAASQDLLIENDWHSVELLNLVHSQLAHFKALLGSRILVDGPPARLTAAAAQSIGMTLHELATNASKYGALSNAQGRVHITWSIEPVHEPALTMHWREVDGPDVYPPQRTGFGGVVIVRMIESALYGTVNLEYRKAGLIWELTAPVKHTLARTGHQRLE